MAPAGSLALISFQRAPTSAASSRSRSSDRRPLGPLVSLDTTWTTSSFPLTLDAMRAARRSSASFPGAAVTATMMRTPALAQADVGLAMNTGTQAAKEAGNMVDLDSNPTKLIEVVEVAK